MALRAGAGGRAVIRVLRAVLLAALLASCGRVSRDDVLYSCGGDPDCGEGWSCGVDRVCRPVAATPDAGVTPPPGCTACREGQRCAESLECVCDGVSCPEGCCDETGFCRASSDDTCGVGGGRCRRCPETTACSAGACG